MADKNTRHSYEDSCRRLQKDYLDSESIPPIPKRLPRHDDEVLGVSFFRTFVGEGDDLSNLTLPRAFFGRSKIENASFRNTDFRESNFCWNDFINVDFTDALLARSDLRASVFRDVKFARTDLRRADMRGSFKNCNFDGARMRGAILTRLGGMSLKLSTKQRNEIKWVWFQGELPSGG